MTLGGEWTISRFCNRNIESTGDRATKEEYGKDKMVLIKRFIFGKVINNRL